MALRRRMKDILGEIDELAKAGKRSVLACITSSEGSTPRGQGACMLVDAEGRAAGTVGGGVLEHECEQIADEVLRTGVEQTRQFRLTNTGGGDLGMLCGGDVDVQFLLVDPADPASLERALQAARIRRPRVFVFGGGHVAQALVPVLASVDFDCTVLEDRPDFADIALFPGAREARVIDNNRVLEEVDIGSEDWVVVMTRGHENDLLIQSQVMRSPARYIGVIGSDRKTRTLTKKLHEMGFTDEDFERVRAPIGIPIQSETPAEIAVSIAAQMIDERAKSRSGEEAK